MSTIEIQKMGQLDKRKQFSCRVCPLMIFSNEKDYLMHIKDDHNGVINCEMCNICGKTFQARSQLSVHVKSKCGTEKCFTCQECGKKLMSAGSLHNHMKTHKEEANFMCKFCAKRFRFTGQLKVHEKTHTKEKDFVCQECGKGFSHRQSLITHASLHSGVKPYQCEGCGKSFSCVGNLLKHRMKLKDTCGVFPLTNHRVQNPSTKMKVLINTPQSSKLKRIEIRKKLEARIEKLDIIKEKESRKLDLKDDCRISEVKSSMNQSYNTSRRGLSNEDLTARGNNSEITINERKDEAPNPEDMHNLNSSKKKSHKDYMYVCEVCGTTFKQKFLLETHLLSNCGEQPTHQCRICDKMFSTKYVLKAHLRVHISGKDLICKFCSKTFRWKGQLKIHERGHTGEKPFACLFCPSSFAYRESLITHSSQHTGNKPYVCKCCGWRFSCIANLKKHKVTHFDSCGLWYREHDRRQGKK